MWLRLRLRSATLTHSPPVPPPDHEVIVLGGGPAGCAAATLLARRSHRVALVHPAEPPAAALAESIPPSARRLFEELGALEALEAAAFMPNRGNSVWWGGGEMRSESFPSGQTGFHADRAGLERVLVEVARSAGVDVLDGLSARRAEESPTGWTLQCEASDGRLRSLHAPWVIDATGRRGFLARGEGRVPDRSTTTLALVRRWKKPGGWEGDATHHTLVESYAHGWAWSVPISPEVRCFTAMVDQRHADLSGSDVGAMLDAELAATKHVGAAREGAQPLGDAWACPASLYTASTFGRRGLLLAGDAGSFIDPLSSFGVKKALSSGWLAAIVAHTALVDPEMTDDAIAFFDEREREVYRSYRRISTAFFEDAAAQHGTPYWTNRAEAARAALDAPVGGTPPGMRLPTELGAGSGPPESTAAVEAGTHTVDPDVIGPEVPESEVRAAFEEIRTRDHLRAVPGATLRVFERPGIEGYRLVRREHLASDRCPTGIRHVRGVDLRHLLSVAPKHTAVPDGWTAYNGVAPPVALPDYLTALATAFATGLLEHGED